jgi:dCMP deaminase
MSDTPAARFPLHWQHRFMRLALEVGSWSKDPRSKVGAILVDNRKRVIGLGYNGFPRNIEDDPALLTSREAKLARMVHAEVNAILNATSSVEGAAIFTTLHPCGECSKIIIQCGVSHIYHLQSPEGHPRWAADFAQADQVLGEAGVFIHEISLYEMGLKAEDML